ncbi:hypothetical protein M5689_007383 [Euphorbia peplus]|nr:hypothetical protein M5689_007383 [Euphorbia peplus]
MKSGKTKTPIDLSSLKSNLQNPMLCNFSVKETIFSAEINDLKSQILQILKLFRFPGVFIDELPLLHTSILIEIKEIYEWLGEQLANRFFFQLICTGSLHFLYKRILYTMFSCDTRTVS